VNQAANLRDRQLAERERNRREEAERAEQARLAAKRQRERTLLRMAQDNHRAETIRTWVARVEAYATRGGERPAGLASWAAWALQVADELDPLVGFAEILAADGSSRTTPDQAAVAGPP
jgi:kynureninase